MNSTHLPEDLLTVLTSLAARANRAMLIKQSDGSMYEIGADGSAQTHAGPNSFISHAPPADQISPPDDQGLVKAERTAEQNATRYEDQISQLKALLSVAQRQQGEIEETLNKERQAFDNEREKLEQSLESRSKVNARLELENKQLSELVDTTSRDRDSAQAHLETSREKYDALALEHSTLVQAHNNISAQVIDSVSSFTRRIETARQRITALSTDIRSRTTSEATEATELATRLERTQYELEKLREEARHDRQNLGEIQDRLTVATSTIEMLRDENMTLTKELEAARNETRVQEDLTEQQNRFEDLTRQLERLQDEASTERLEHEDQIATFTARITELQRENTVLQDRIGAALDSSHTGDSASGDNQDTSDNTKERASRRRPIIFLTATLITLVAIAISGLFTKPGDAGPSREGPVVNIATEAGPPSLTPASPTVDSSQPAATPTLPTSSPTQNTPKETPTTKEPAPTPTPAPAPTPDPRPTPTPAPAPAPAPTPTPAPAPAPRPTLTANPTPRPAPAPAPAGHVTALSSSVNATGTTASITATVTTSGATTVNVTATVAGRTVSLGSKTVNGTATFTGTAPVTTGSHPWRVNAGGLSNTGTLVVQ